MGAAGFPLGRLCATRGVAHDMERDAAFARFVAGSLARYRYCDWGDVCPQDKWANDRAVKGGERLLSVYHSKDGVKFWIITEWDRSATTVLLPEDY